MHQRFQLFSNFFLFGLCCVLLVGCSSAPTPAAQPNSGQQPSPTASLSSALTPTVDECSPTGIVPVVKQIQAKMQEFDDVTFVANMTAQAQLVDPILRLQDIRRDVENLTVPSCAATLQSAAVAYMNGVITTLTHFMGGMQTEVVNQEVSASQNLRIQYETERARLLGVTYIPQPTLTPAPTSAPAATGTPKAQEVTPAESISGIRITNNSAAPVNLRANPSTSGEVVGILSPNQSLTAVARNEAGDWIQVNAPEVAGGTAWVFGKLVSLDPSADGLPVTGGAPVNPSGTPSTP